MDEPFLCLALYLLLLCDRSDKIFHDVECMMNRIIITQPNQDVCCEAINLHHILDLLVPLRKISLIDAYCIDPEDARGVAKPQALEG
jgi:hypothetical protein